MLTTIVSKKRLTLQRHSIRRTICSMYKRLLLLINLLPTLCMAQPTSDSLSVDSTLRTFVVVNMETGIPVRNVVVHANDGQGARTTWEGKFSLRDGYREVTFSHASFVKRVMYAEEMKGDTIGLLPHMLAVNEVVIWGRRRNMTSMIIPKPSETELQLQQAVPQGFNPLGLLFWGFDELWGKKSRHRKEMREQRKKMIIDNY